MKYNGMIIYSLVIAHSILKKSRLILRFYILFCSINSAKFTSFVAYNPVGIDDENANKMISP